jgi:hypothetical protein
MRLKTLLAGACGASLALASAANAQYNGPWTQTWNFNQPGNFEGWVMNSVSLNGGYNSQANHTHGTTAQITLDAVTNDNGLYMPPETFFDYALGASYTEFVYSVDLTYLNPQFRLSGMGMGWYNDNTPGDGVNWNWFGTLEGRQSGGSALLFDDDGMSTIYANNYIHGSAAPANITLLVEYNLGGSGVYNVWFKANVTQNPGGANHDGTWKLAYSNIPINGGNGVVAVNQLRLGGVPYNWKGDDHDTNAIYTKAQFWGLPEPATLGLLALGIPMLRRRRSA